MKIQLTDPAGVVIHEMYAPTGELLQVLYDKTSSTFMKILDDQVRAAVAIPATTNVKIRAIVT